MLPSFDESHGGRCQGYREIDGLRKINRGCSVEVCSFEYVQNVLILSFKLLGVPVSRSRSQIRLSFAVYPSLRMVPGLANNATGCAVILAGTKQRALIEITFHGGKKEGGANESKFQLQR